MTATHSSWVCDWLLKCLFISVDRTSVGGGGFGGSISAVGAGMEVGTTSHLPDPTLSH